MLNIITKSITKWLNSIEISISFKFTPQNCSYSAICFVSLPPTNFVTCIYIVLNFLPMLIKVT